MHQRALKLQEMADFFDDAVWTGAIREPNVAINTGTHPRFGSFITIQDWDPDYVILHSEFPLDLPLPAHTMPVGGVCELAA